MAPLDTESWKPCPICTQPAQFYCRKKTASYYRSQDCGLIFQSPLPSPKAMASYAANEYADGMYKDYLQAREMKLETFRRRLPDIQALMHTDRGKPKLLDVGCSCGYFIDVALDAGFDAYGVEFAQEAVNAASPAAKPRITHGNVNSIGREGSGTYDVVTAFDIIEHTEAPIDFLHMLRALLKPQGLIVLTTPDTGHFLRRLMGARWPMLQPLQHTFLFSKASMNRALRDTGFTEIQAKTARKSLSMDYLLNQVKSSNPMIYGLYRLIAPSIPSPIRQKARSVNIGEFLMTARRPSDP